MRFRSAPIFMKKIVIAIDSFKGSLKSIEAGRAAAAGVKRVNPKTEVCVVSVADGGEGTLDALSGMPDFENVVRKVADPMGRPVDATYKINGDKAIIELAQASGLSLVALSDRNLPEASSYGTGELIEDALNRGCREILICIGGSATNDAGVGLLQALGYHFLDADGLEVGRGAAEVGRIRSIDASHAMAEIKEASFTVACDVKNPLTGADGASAVYGPQKGADNEMVDFLDKALTRFASVAGDFLGKDYSMVPGAGAAGGVGFALHAFLNARLCAGIDLVLDAVGFDNCLSDADLVITGEGCLDQQTCMGKVANGILNRALCRSIPVIAIGGMIENDAVEALMKSGFKAVFPIVERPMTLEEAMAPNTAIRNIERTVAQIIRTMS